MAARAAKIKLFDYLYPDNPIIYALGYRVVAFIGRYGSGKSLSAVALVHSLLNGNYGFRSIIANMPLSIPGFNLVRKYNDRPSEWPESSVILIDEAWQHLFLDATPNQIKSFLAYLRKNNNVLLLTSVLPLSRRISGVTIMRHYNLQVVGINLWVMSINLPSTDPSVYYVNPVNYYGMYDTKYIPSREFYFYDRYNDS